MKKGILHASCIVFATTILTLPLAHAYSGKTLCQYPEFTCLKVKKQDTWESRWPDPRERDLVMRLNRTNLPLSSRSWVVVPKNLNSITLLDIAPFPAQMDTA